jgi:hypothetical protein
MCTPDEHEFIQEQLSGLPAPAQADMQPRAVPQHRVGQVVGIQVLPEARG